MAEIKFKDVITLPNILKIHVKKQVIPEYITSNLKHPLFQWQEEALKYFLAYCENKSDVDNNPYTHLMFNLATGAGKTLLMASSILYYYKQGYRNFLFFVNQNNIVDKTEQNLANKYHPKYLFSQDIIINNKRIEIRNVDNFSDGQDGIIEIKFTNIAKFHGDIYKEKENINTLDDLHKKNIVMLADEAHHFNADTKKVQKYVDENELIPENMENCKDKDKVEGKCWEKTITNLVLQKKDKYFNKTNTENKNVLLEFTATIPNNENVVKKYKDKTIFCFELKDFLAKGYTKQINLLSSQSDKKNRILIALLFNWYRHKIALKNNIPNFKSVILFRSKLIEESKEDFEFFKNLIDKLTKEDIENLKQEANINKSDNKLIHEQASDRFTQIWNYIAKENIELQEVVNFIKDSFQDRNLIITNSEEKGAKSKDRGGEKTTEEQESLLNNLEQKDNPIRAIFTVDRLTEGWDVLNLFDIVRLYQGQNAGGSDKKTPQTTIKEKQLIGRGVRYYPFQYQDKENNKRKFDDELNNELRVLEELFYHTYDEESRYISHLKAELQKDGYIDDGKEIVEFDLKEDFKKTDFYKNVKILQNEKIDNPDKKKNTIESIKKEEYFAYNLAQSNLKQTSIHDKNDNAIPSSNETNNKIQLKKLIDRHILRKAIFKTGNLGFNNLLNEFEIKSIEDLLEDKFLGDFQINLKLDKKIDEISGKEKLDIATGFVDWFDKKTKEYSHPYRGTKEFKAFSFKEIFSEPKKKMVAKNSAKTRNDNWYIMNQSVLNEDEEACLNDITTNLINTIKDKKEIYLLRNEEVYKMYNFDDGQGFQPDFMIFIKGKESVYYQILVEVKGGQFKDADGGFDKSKEGRKQDFLLKLEKLNDGRSFSVENKYYKLIGLPFYNESRKNDFLNKIKIINEIVES
jgi:type III restriction enzyme